MAAVRTVLGDIAAGDLGRTDYHEHLFQVTPLLPCDELDDEPRSGAEAAMFRESGFSAMVEATPTALGRNAAGIARISAATGLHVVATSGAHREAHYGPGHWLLELKEAQLGARFTRDVEVGIPRIDEPDSGDLALAPSGMPVRAGMLKAGIGYWSVTTFERRVLAGVAEAHDRTGAPVMVHLEHGSAAIEVLGILFSDGVAPDAVALAHIDRNPDPGLHAELAAAGAYLGYDCFARPRTWPDQMILDTLMTTAALGATHRVLLGADVARRTRFVAHGGLPGMRYLGDRVVPRLVRSVGAELVEAVLVTNPARLLGRFGVAAAPKANSIVRGDVA
jgi:phosphotriesterase-related protein